MHSGITPDKNSAKCSALEEILNHPVPPLSFSPALTKASLTPVVLPTTASSLVQLPDVSLLPPSMIPAEKIPLPTTAPIPPIASSVSSAAELLSSIQSMCTNNVIRSSDDGDSSQNINSEAEKGSEGFPVSISESVSSSTEIVDNCNSDIGSQVNTAAGSKGCERENDDVNDNDVDGDFYLPMSFANTQDLVDNDYEDEYNYNECDLTPVNINIPIKDVGIFCPLPYPYHSKEFESSPLEDRDNIFLVFPGHLFEEYNSVSPLLVNLNGFALTLMPVTEEVKSFCRKLRTSVKKFKQWVELQGLKMEVCKGQKRKILLKQGPHYLKRMRTIFLRSFLLLQENYNIMMSIFRHLSMVDLLRLVLNPFFHKGGRTSALV